MAPQAGTTPDSQPTTDAEQPQGANAVQTVPQQEISARRATARRMAWLLGGIIVLIYLLGFLVQRH